MSAREAAATQALHEKFSARPMYWGRLVDITIGAADAHDAAQGVRRIRISGRTLLRAAEAAAFVDDYDGCFERVREWEAMEPWDKEREYPSDDLESCAWWIKRTRAVFAAAAEVQS